MVVMLPTARVAVIVLNWNGAEVLPACLDALRAQAGVEFAALIVDNGSDDGSREMAERACPEMDLLALPRNLGFAAGNNAGIEHVWRENPSVEFIALLNNDTCVQPSWLATLMTALANRPDAGMAASKILYWDGQHQPTTIDTAGDIFYTYGLASKRGTGKLASAYGTPDEIFGASAVAVLYRATLLRQIGLFDPQFFAYNEDVDLSFRAQLMGWRCVYEPTAVVWHRVSFSTRCSCDRTMVWTKRNTVWVLVKNMPTLLLWWYLPQIALHFILSDVAWMLRGRCVPVMQGRWQAFRGLRAMLGQRGHIQATRLLSNRELCARLTTPSSAYLSQRTVLHQSS